MLFRSRVYGKWKVIAFTEDERSYTRNINFRGAIGAGAERILVKTSTVKLSVSEAILPEYYWSKSNDVNNNFTIRSSSRLKFELNVKSITASSVTLFQPSIFSDRKTNFADNLNLRSTNTVSIKVHNHYSVGLIYTISYQGYPHFVNSSVSPTQENLSILVTYYIK